MKILLKACLMFLAGVVAISAMLFIPAGTLDYWQAQMYLASIFLPMLFVLLYFLKNDPAFLERRFKMKEKEKEQRLVQKLGAPFYLIGILLPGLSVRFGWPMAPAEISIVADAAVLLGYAIMFLVFRENSFAGRTIEVVKGQKVISTGLYAIIRHPMYLGMLLFSTATPIALGSYAAVLFFLPMFPLIALRIRNEEEVLGRELEGYEEYCKKVKWRLAPWIW